MKHWYDKEFQCIVCEPDCVDEWLWHIWAIGLDYDGCNTVESLKELVDELVDMALKARNCLHDGKLFEDKNESSRSLEEAHCERKRCENAEIVCNK